MKVLAISGSLRAASINPAPLRTMSAVIVEAASISASCSAPI
jgi:NAD(P)H-dependent FMN reductase